MKHLYKFGGFYLDPLNKRLLKDEGAVQLAPKTFDTLCVLVEAKGNVVTKDELLEKVWQSSIVEENNLTQHISALRKILGETPEGIRYIETIPKRGYRFAVGVEDVDDALIIELRRRSRIVIEQQNISQEPKSEVAVLDATETQVKVLPAPKQTFWQTHQKVIVASVILVLLIAVFIAWQNWNPTPSPEEQWRGGILETQLISLKLKTGETIKLGRFSPTGQMVAYTLDKDGTSNILVTKPGSDISHPLTNEKSNNRNPIWSPDGQQLAFLSDRSNQLGLWAMDSFGGTPKHIVNFDEYGTKGKEGVPTLVRWSKKEEMIIYYQWGSNLFTLNTQTKEKVQVTSFDPAKAEPRDFSVSPDETDIAYVDNQNGQIDLWHMSLLDKQAVQITNDSATERCPVWYPTGKTLVYKTFNGNSNQICLRNLESDQTIPIKLECDDGALTDVSPDGRQMLYSNNKIGADIWKLNLETEEETPVTSGSDMEFWADAAPNGETIAYHAIKGTQGRWDRRESLLFTKPTDSESPGVELATKAYDGQWSPDGKSIAFLRVAERFNDLYVIGAKGNEERKLVSGNVQYGGQHPNTFNRLLTKDYCWSPDSSKIAYSFTQDGVNNIWVVSADGSSNSKSSNNTDAVLEMKCPLWSPDGKRLAYVSGYDKQTANENQAWSLWVSDIDKPIFQTNAILRLLGWSGDNELIVAMVENKGQTKDTPTKVTMSKIAMNIEHKITPLESAYFTNVQLSPDKKSLAFVASPNGRANIYTLSTSGNNLKQVTQNSDPRLYFSALSWSADSKALFYGKNEVTYGLTLITSKGD